MGNSYMMANFLKYSTIIIVNVYIFIYFPIPTLIFLKQYKNSFLILVEGGNKGIGELTP